MLFRSFQMMNCSVGYKWAKAHARGRETEEERTIVMQEGRRVTEDVVDRKETPVYW